MKSILAAVLLLFLAPAIGGDPFYTPPSPLRPGPPGTLLRASPVTFAPKGARGWRILYRSEDSSGAPTVSSGMVFAPAAAAPAAGRFVVAWAHGTVGLAPQCAPSRSSQPLTDMDWLGGMISSGWVVVATDYAGLGTPGVQHYLIGADEARDVLNSVRAARQLVGAGAGRRFATWGHSQGGHASLFAAQISARYAPELQLIAAAAAAPAAELVSLMSQQFRSAIGWVIGPEVVRVWPDVYPGLAPSDVASPAGLRNYQRLAAECVFHSSMAIEAEIRSKLGESFFARDPSTVPAWRARAEENTPTPLAPAVPVLIAQGLADEVVLPNTTSLLAQRWCAAHSRLTMLWLKATNHVQVAGVAGPAVTAWLRQRAAGVTATATCGATLPVPPAK
ncbi:MAG TPA: lipase family protein [bacterium]|jgi:alpha-beta hydrolase superfamily lysophospholipase